MVDVEASVLAKLKNKAKESGYAKELLGSDDIIIIYSRHVETVILLQRI